MKYIRNTGRYAISFTVMVGALEQKVVLDRKRIYMDTGNIATSGITEVDDKAYAVLKDVPEFKALIEKGELSLVKESELNAGADAKDKKIAELEAKLEKADTAKVEKELADKDKEIADLKAQLEAKGKKAEKPAEEVKDEAEGF